jgi:protein-L-isoaspartate(D-aspartate) O-methyltransferase
MVSAQMQRRGIRDDRVLEAFEQVPRHLFVPERMRHMAYEDMPLPIGRDQTISQPYIVALMTSLLELRGDERVLEVGTGSGYQAAILGRLAAEVHTVELLPDLAEHAEQLLHQLGYSNVRVHVGDGTLGWPAGAPYPAIVGTAAAPRVPPPLLDQLQEGGRLVLPVAHEYQQLLKVITRHGDDYDERVVMSVAFVPMRGRYGWG